jgi:hypothetical protein
MTNVIIIIIIITTTTTTIIIIISGTTALSGPWAFPEFSANHLYSPIPNTHLSQVIIHNINPSYFEPSHSSF